MAIEYYDAVNGDGLFNILGKAFFAASTLNTARGTTVPAEFIDFIDQYKLKTNATLTMDAGMSIVPQGVQAFQTAGAIALTNIREFITTLVIEVVNEDSPRPLRSLPLALEYLVKAMIVDLYYVDANAVTLTLAADAGNSATDLAIAYTTKRGDGLVNQNMLAEVLTFEVTSTDRETGAAIAVESPAAADSLDAEWPLSSGTSTAFTATDPAASLLTNGDFEDESAELTNLPNGWIVGVGIAGTDFAMTSEEIQTVTLSGSPSSGVYWIKWASPEGQTYSTAEIPFDATASTVEAAVQTIPGLEGVTVVTTGTAPNLVHTLTMTGTDGNINTVTILNQTNGTITPAQATAGSANAFNGRSLTMTGDASTLTALYLPLDTLTADTVYFIQWRHRKSGTPAAGIVRISIKDSIGGSPVADSAGTSNTVSYDLTAGTVTTSFTSAFLAIRVKPSQRQPLYLCIEQTTAISAATVYAIDEISLDEGIELYPGGPIVSAAGGKLGAYAGDKWTLTVTNDAAGTLQTWFERFFDMNALGLLLPTSGSTNIPDSVVG